MPLHRLAKFSTILHLASFLLPSLANPILKRSSAHEIYNFGYGTWAENLAVQSNGKVLVTLLTTPHIYQIFFNYKSSSVFYTFPATTSCQGITELTPDIFYVATGNISTRTFTWSPGSFSVWQLNMTTTFPSSSSPTTNHNYNHKNNSTPASVSKLADLPQSSALNGMTNLGPTSSTLLIADSKAGAIWSLNVTSGRINKAISDPLMQPTSAGPMGIGVNGVKARDGTLYFTNQNLAIYAKIPVGADGTALGSGVVLASDVVLVDDFQIEDAAGGGGGGGDVAFLAGDDEVRVYAPGRGEVARVVQDGPLLAGSTACDFGREEEEEGVGRRVLYVTTSGGALGYLTGNFTQPGRLVAVDV